MKHQYGKILWIDNRITGKFEGQVLAESGTRYYFNYSTWHHGLEPSRDESIKFRLDESNQIISVTDLCGTLTKELL